MTTVLSLEIGHTPNYARVDVGPITLWYSYRTVIAFHVSGGNTTVRENDWGPTTGKHLNMIDGDDKKSRINGQEFEARLAAIVDQIKVTA